MKKLRVISLILICALTLVTLVACFDHIEDTNGEEDFSLVTITDEDFIQYSHSLVSNNSVRTEIGNRTKLKIGKISGIDIIEEFSVFGSGSVTISMNMSVTSGNCRLVLVHNEQIVYDFNINGEDSFVATERGHYYLKIGGESATVSMEYTIVSKF